MVVVAQTVEIKVTFQIMSQSIRQAPHGAVEYHCVW